MSKISSKTIGLLVDGKSIDVKVQSKLNFELNKSLNNKDNFQEFIKDPQSYAAKYDLKIDKNISASLSKMLSGFSSIKDLQRTRPGGTVMATVWAIAQGAYSTATSKVAIAF